MVVEGIVDVVVVEGIVTGGDVVVVEGIVTGGDVGVW